VSSIRLLEDRYRTVLVEKLREKQAEMPVKLEATAPSRQNVIDLMAALKRSLNVERETEGGSVEKAKARSAAASAKPSARKRSSSVPMLFSPTALATGWHGE
jgi:non-homologous end joining protein Ku